MGPDTLFVFRLVIPRCAAQVQALRDLSCCLSLITTASSMSEFDPSQPAILHDALKDQIIPWAGLSEDVEHFRKYAIYDTNGTVAWDGLILDGWGEPLGG